jgi:hypothetical protein
MALSAAKPRVFVADVPQIDMVLPLKATTQVYEGSLLMFSSGAVTPVSGAGIFAGVCLETALGGASDGTVLVKVRVSGAMEIALAGGDVAAITLVGVAATVPEATDDDTLRIETAATVTGTNIGKFMRMVTAGANGTMVVGFKGAQAA